MAILLFIKNIFYGLNVKRYRYGLAFSVLVHVALIFIVQTHPGVDGLIYQGVAQSINESDSFLACGAFSGAYWPPLFCIYLASFYKLFGHTSWLFFLLNILIAVSTAVVSQKYLRRIFGETTSRWAVLLCLNSILIFNFQFYYKYELLTGLLFAVALYFLFKNSQLSWNDLFWSGLFFGLSALATGRVLAMVPAVLIYIVGCHKNRLKPVTKSVFPALLLFLFGIMLAVTPWTIRNYVCFEKLIPITTNSGLNFYTGFNENANGGYLHRHQLPEPFDEWDRNDNGAFYKGGLSFISDNPGRAMLLMLKKVNLIWRVHYLDTALIYPFFYFGIFFLVRLLPASRKPEARMVQYMVLFYSLFHCLFIARYYYIVPILPLVYGVAIAIQRYLGRKIMELLDNQPKVNASQ